MDTEDAAMVRVRRSSIAPCLIRGICILRDATTVSECLRSFCRKCISEKFEEEDNKHCPTCNADLGCHPKLRVDRSLQCISLVIFPAKRRKMEEISSPHPELILLPALSSQANGVYHSVEKMDAHLVSQPMDADTFLQQWKSLQREGVHCRLLLPKARHKR